MFGGPPFDVVVVVGSQGGLSAIQTVLGCLSASFPAAILLDLHRSAGLAFTEQLLQRRSALAVRPACDGLGLNRGTVYLAPWNAKLAVTKDRLLDVVERSPSSWWHHDVDLLLGSAAEVYGPRLIAVVLSGRLEGGAAGVREVKRRGGRVLVQDSTTAAAASMPNAALATGCVDFALSPQALGGALVALCAAAGAAELFRVRLNAGARG